MSKYHSKKVVIDGIDFDSKKEANRFRELSLMQKSGAITDLERQVKFKLIPAQYRPVFDKKTRKWKDRCVERECSYVADFTYLDKEGKLHVEDVKGYKGGGAYALFSMKRKLMLHMHGIVVEEV